jgi:glyoxylase-like metal-dependent hydrolase (beta-lactamase superfamily II)
VALEADDDFTFKPDVALADGDCVAGPDWTLEAVETPGHTSNHLCFAWLEANALFSGDHVMGWSTTVISPPDGDMDDYLASLDKIAARGFAAIWPTHGPPITADPSGFVAAFKAHRLNREAADSGGASRGPDDHPRYGSGDVCRCQSASSSGGLPLCAGACHQAHEAPASEARRR